MGCIYIFDGVIYETEENAGNVMVNGTDFLLEFTVNFLGYIMKGVLLPAHEGVVYDGFCEHGNESRRDAVPRYVENACSEQRAFISAVEIIKISRHALHRFKEKCAIP